MADGTYPGLVSKDRDLNAATNPIWVELTDGSAALSVTSTVLNVNAAVTGSVTANVDYDYAVDTAAGGTDVGAMILAVRDDALTTLTPADGDYVSLRVNSTGALWVSGTPLALATDAVKVSGNTNANTVLNPIFVQNVSTGVTSNEVHSYLDGTSSGEAASNHSYTVTGSVFLLKSVIASCSGAMKFEVWTGPTAGLVQQATGFLTGRQGDTKQIYFDPPIEVLPASTGIVRVIRYSRNGGAVNVDVYSTIIGNDVV